MELIMLVCFVIFTFYLCMYLLKNPYISTKFAAICVVVQIHLSSIAFLAILPREHMYLTAFYYIGSIIFFNWYEKRNYLTENNEQ